MPKSEPKPVAIEDIAANLGIAEPDVVAMLKSESAPFGKDYRGRPAVPASYGDRLSTRADYFSSGCPRGGP